MLLNLVGNALKFTQRGEVEVRVVLSQGRLRLAVRDTGPGIAAEDLAQLFQPFVQVGPAQSQEEGSGLGLALSRELAALMGGGVRIADLRLISGGNARRAWSFDAVDTGGAGTPWVIISVKGKNTAVNGALPYEQMKAAIEQAIKQI